VKTQVERIFSDHPVELHRQVAVRPDWYY